MLSPDADWTLRTLAGMPGTPRITPVDLVRAVVADRASSAEDVLQELVDADRAVRLEPTRYELDHIVLPLSSGDDLSGYAAILMYYAIQAAGADRRLHPRGWRLGVVYEYATGFLATRAAAVKWYHDNHAVLLGLLNGGMRYDIDNATCELAEAVWALASHTGDHFTAFMTQVVAVGFRSVTDRPELRLAMAQARLAHLLSSRELHPDAFANADCAVELAAQLADRSVLSIAHAARGRTHQLHADLANALAEYTTSLNIAEQINDPGNRGRHLRAAPAHGQVLTPSPAAERLMMNIGDALWLNTEAPNSTDGLALGHMRIASVQAARGDTAAAIEHLRSAERLMLEIEDSAAHALVLMCLARTLLDAGNPSDGHAAVVRTFEVFKHGDNDLYLAEAAAIAGEATEHSNPAKTRAYLLLAIAKFADCGQAERAAAVQHHLDQLDLR